MGYINNGQSDRKSVTTLRLQEMKNAGRKIVCLTAYDALVSEILDETDVDVILVGDSLGNVIQGLETTLPVTLEDIAYHTKLVKNGAKRALVIADMPFMTYQVSVDLAFTNAGRLLKETGCGAVKLEGAGPIVLAAISRMTESGIPVMGHLGLTPQSINKFGSYRTRGTNPAEAEKIISDAKKVEAAGAFAIVLEKIPYELAKRITSELTIPTIGIGAGPYCDGQILVYADMLGLTQSDFQPRFVRKYADLRSQIKNSVEDYCNDVRANTFPTIDESYTK